MLLSGKFLLNLRLADPKFNVPAKVNMLWKPLNEHRIDLQKDVPPLFDTRFGWKVGGSVEITNPIFTRHVYTSVHNNDFLSIIVLFCR